MKNASSKYNDFIRVLDSIYNYNFSTGEFLLPISNSKKTRLMLLKKLFDGRNVFLLKSVNVEKIAKNSYVLVVKGKKQEIKI